MRLNWYRRPRMVVLNPGASAMEAARAIEANDIGAVVIQQRGRVVGIVTDRDLAMRVVGSGLDPIETTLAEVMTAPVACLSPRDSHQQALSLMRQKRVRRIPLVEDEKVVGMVTLDDLLLDEVVPIEALAPVIEAQIGAGGPAPSPRLPARQRSAARAEATFRRFINRVRDDTSLSAEQAELALEVVLNLLVQRLVPNEAEHLIAQLPSLMQPSLRAYATGPDRRITHQTIVDGLAARFDLEQERASDLLAAIGTSLARSVSPGEWDEVLRQLPTEMREAFGEPPRPSL